MVTPLFAISNAQDGQEDEGDIALVLRSSYPYCCLVVREEVNGAACEMYAAPGTLKAMGGGQRGGMWDVRRAVALGGAGTEGGANGRGVNETACGIHAVSLLF